jgi:hypothetical protein
VRLLEVLLHPVIVAWDKLDEWADIDTEADPVEEGDLFPVTEEVEDE